MGQWEIFDILESGTALICYKIDQVVLQTVSFFLY